MAQQVKDPVCGMRIDPEKTEHRSEYKGRDYYFCSSSCKTQFDSDPEQFVESGDK